MGTRPVIGKAPSIDIATRFRQRREPVRIQTLFAWSAVDRFDIGIIGRIARPRAKASSTPLASAPLIQRPRHELGSVIDAEPLRSSFEHRHCVDFPNHVLTSKAHGHNPRRRHLDVQPGQPGCIGELMKTLSVASGKTGKGHLRYSHRRAGIRYV